MAAAISERGLGLPGQDILPKDKGKIAAEQSRQIVIRKSVHSRLPDPARFVRFPGVPMHSAHVEPC